MIRFLFLLCGLGTGETLYMSRQEKSPFTVRDSVPVPYYTQLKHTHAHSMQPDEDLNRSKPVVAIGLSRVVSLLLVLI